MARITLDKDGYVVHSDRHSNGNSERSLGRHGWGSGSNNTGDRGRGGGRSLGSDRGGGRSLGSDRGGGGR